MMWWQEVRWIRRTDLEVAEIGSLENEVRRLTRSQAKPST